MKLRPHAGLTVLELMIVLAIIAMGFVLVRSGFRQVTKADLVEDSTSLAAVLRRASQLAIEHGEMHRVVMDFDKDGYVVEVCHGQTGLVRNGRVDPDVEKVKRAIARGKRRLKGLPAGTTSDTDPEAAVRRALAVAGKHIADRTCAPVKDAISGDASGKGWARGLRKSKGIKFKEVWVAHRDHGVTKGRVALYFFPTGESEKAVIELTDGKATFSVLVTGLTGRVDVKDGALDDVDAHMMRNVMGDHDKPRGGEATP